MKKTIIYLLIALFSLSLGLTIPSNVIGQVTNTSNIKVLNYSYYISSLGYLDVVGEIQNTGPSTISHVLLSGSVFSVDGTDQADQISQALVAYLIPQQIAPFAMEFNFPRNSPDGSWNSLIQSGQISNFTFSVLQANETTSYQYPDLKIVSSQSTIITSSGNNGAFEVNGVIENTGSQPANNLTVVGAFYNSSGTVIAIGYTDYLTPSTLAPSGNLSFQILAFDLNQTDVSTAQEITSYLLLPQAQGPILQGTPPVVSPYQADASSTIPAQTSSPTSAPTPTATASNPNSSPTNFELIGLIAVVVIIVVAAVILLSKRTTYQTVKQRKKARNKRINEISVTGSAIWHVKP